MSLASFHFSQTSPYFWYFYSAIPRGLGSTVLIIPFALLYEKRVRRLLVPALGFVFLYSFLPHKELRFIIYTFPLFNISAAIVCDRMLVCELVGVNAAIVLRKHINTFAWYLSFSWNSKNKSSRRILLRVAVLSHLLINFAFSMLLLKIASYNYPGGTAIFKLHSLEKHRTDVRVHIDVLSAQTGVSRFTQLHDQWRLKS